MWHIMECTKVAQSRHILSELSTQTVVRIFFPLFFFIVLRYENSAGNRNSFFFCKFKCYGTHIQWSLPVFTVFWWRKCYFNSHYFGAWFHAFFVLLLLQIFSRIGCEMGQSDWRSSPQMHCWIAVVRPSSSFSYFLTRIGCDKLLIVWRNALPRFFSSHFNSYSQTVNNAQCQTEKKTWL